MSAGGGQNEGDQIILYALKQIECDVGSIQSINEMTPEMVVDVVAKSLFLISEGEMKFSSKLPPNVASRHRICTNMAAKVKELGFVGTMGYNQLLYPSESEIKDLIFWLVQKLPRTEEDSAEEALGANALLNKRITDALKTWVGSTWKLPFCTKGTPALNIYANRSLRTVSGEDGQDIRRVFKCSGKMKVGAESTIFQQHNMELITDARYTQRLEEDLSNLDGGAGGVTGGGKAAGTAEARKAALASLLKNSFQTARANLTGVDGNGEVGNGKTSSLNELLATLAKGDGGPGGGGRGTRFQHATEFAQEKAGSVGLGDQRSFAAMSKLGAELDAEDAEIRKKRLEDEEKAREEELCALRTEIDSGGSKLESLQTTQENSLSRILQLDSELKELQGLGESFEKDILVKRKVLEMLPQAAENIGKLQTICAASSSRLLKLGQEWETHRRPLIDKVRALQNSSADRRNRCRDMVEEMKTCREEMAAMINDLKEKQERATVLADELDKLPKNINRTLYTHRIMDIITSISKQNIDIDKIANDIRNIQKTINSTSQTLGRSDQAAEELIFAAANAPKSDTATVDTYRGLTTLRAKFDMLNETVSKVGAQEKQSRDLEIKIEQEMTRVNTNNFDRVREDLKSVKSENAALVKKLKAMQ